MALKKLKSSLDDPRLMALCLHYVTDAERRTVDYWYMHRPCKETVDEVRSISLREGWERQRQIYWRGVRAATLRQEELKLLASRVEEVREIQTIRRHLFSMLQPAKAPDGTEYFRVQPKSYEATARAFGFMDQILENKRDAALAQIEPAIAEIEQLRAAEEQEGEARRVVVPFNKQEMRHLAHEMIRKRREQLLAAEMSQDEED